MKSGEKFTDVAVFHDSSFDMPVEGIFKVDIGADKNILNDVSLEFVKLRRNRLETELRKSRYVTTKLSTIVNQRPGIYILLTCRSSSDITRADQLRPIDYTPMADQDKWVSKYLKYKNKYLNLKKNI